MPNAKKAAADPALDPNELIRRKAGSYRTADDRFEVSDVGTGWYVVDSAQTDELGQSLVRGPFTTLKAVRDELPVARRATLKPLAPRPRPNSKPKPRAKASSPGRSSSKSRSKPRRR